MRLPVRNPRTGETDHWIEPLDVGALARITARLRANQPDWAALSPEVRGQHLNAFADALVRQRGALVHALTRDTGRARVSAIEVDGTVAMVRRWATRAPALLAPASPRATAIPGIDTQTRLVPYPLVGAISPWNFPLTLALIDAIPAIAAGCAALVKPSEVTPRFIEPLLTAIREVPEIAAVLAVVEGDGATGAALVEQVDFIAFTGSVATGRKVGVAAAVAMIPASLELGGNDPLIVLASADPVAAAHVALLASVLNTGQACQSIERVLVARAVAEPFLAALTSAAQAVRLNHPDIAHGDIGPFIHGPQAAIVQAQIDDAVAKGATVLAGGKVETLGGGLYLRPTVLTGVTPDMAVLRDETFGPVIPVQVFETPDDAVALANAGEFGLSAAVLGEPAEAEAVAVRLRAGAVSINDGSLTSMVWEAEKSSFGASGLGPSRMGDTGLLRFCRRQALIRQTGTPLPLSAYAEDA
ncbi:aldehyde dehydrogenase family protein [Glacieibacterium frigidum]|uniref:Aldehyde dehydrogenase family protein n=1 Tax=Glacieibacterium frigidum TaxID=2593303 RepID=A0A552UHJ6_9SPHN|nr:aldehyde dehydrogenase family protein [Glacieibacterium frigidum]TRW17696.1 aldehyde dehydrogenase family protein [Glacieibacterium frigidum]